MKLIVSIILTMKDSIASELRGMLVFARVIESGNFTRAAKTLGISRAVTSYQVKQLEKRLGVQLINRSTRALSLTSAGRLYYDKCKAIAEQAESAHQLIENLKADAVGRLSISCPVHLGLQWVVPLATAYRQRYPQVELELNLSENITNLVQDGIDLAIRSGPLANSELRSTKLATVSRHICASPEYLNQRGWPQAINELDKHEWIVYHRLASKLNLARQGKSYAIQMQGTLRTNNAAARLQFALSGMGLAVLPHYDAAKAFKTGELIELFPDYEIPPLELFAVFPEGVEKVKASRLMIDMLKNTPP